MLIVDSSRELCESWSSALEVSGYSVLYACDISDGIRLVREGGIDLILLDPGEVSERIDEFVSSLGRLPDAPPFVLLSTSPTAPLISANIGAAGFLPKPCSRDEIVETVARFAAAPIQAVLEDEPTQPHREVFRFGL